MKKIVMCGGGTAGHVYPALAVAERLKDCEIHFLGGNGIEKTILKRQPEISFHQIPTVKFERRLTFRNFCIPFKLASSVKAAKEELKKIAPSVVFSKGGYVSLPVVLAAKSLKIPIVSHESDLSFGLANRIILKRCSIMCTTFEETGKKCKKCIHTGQPIRQKIFEGKKMRVEPNRPTILVLGGSLGARFLNELIWQNLDKICENFNLIHIFGKNNGKKIEKLGYYSFPYLERIEDAYATADIVICRAGSGVINELLALHKPMILVPLSKSSRGDQIENAALFEKLGYAEVLQESDCTFENLMLKVEKLQKNRLKMQKNMQITAKNRASEQIAEILMKF